MTVLCQFKEGEDSPRRVIDLNGFTVDKSDYDNKGRGGLTGLVIALDNSWKLYQKETNEIVTQLTFTCSKSSVETPKKV